jgi:hypothetical protein
MNKNIVGAIVVGVILKYFVGYLIRFPGPLDLVVLVGCIFIAYHFFFREKSVSQSNGGANTGGSSDAPPAPSRDWGNAEADRIANERHASDLDRHNDNLSGGG